MKVPVYDSPQVEERPLGGVRQDSVASPSLFNARAAQQVQTGKQLIAAGDDLGKIAANMQDRENADALFRAETAIKTDYITFEKEARENRRGAAAKDLTKDAADWWDKVGAEHSNKLTNPVQKRLFSQQVAKLRTQSMDGMSAYEAEQRRVSLNESASASISSSINLAASQVGTPTERLAITGAKDDINKRIGALSKINGWTPEMEEAKRAESLTNLHMQVVQNMVNSDPSRAKGYFEANKAEINGANYDAIEKLYKTGAAKEKAQKYVDELQASGISEANGLVIIRQNLKGDEQEQAALEWKTRHAEQTAARERTQRDAADAAYGIYARTGRFSAIPADVLNKLDGRVLLALKKDAQNAAEGTMPKTDWDKYYALRQEAFSNPAAFATRDLRGDFAYLGKAEREGMIDLQTRMRKGDDLKDARTLEQQIGSTVDLLGLTGAGKAEKRGLLERKVGDAISAEEKQRGKKLNYEERQKIIDRMVIEGDVRGEIDFGTRYYDVAGTERAARFVPDVPKDERRKIEAALKRAGRKITDDAVLQLYKQKMGLP